MIKIRVSLRRLTSFVMVYMVLAFGWWAIQLWRVNDQLFAVSRNLLELQYGGRSRGVNLTDLQATAEYKAIVANQKKHRRMVLAEGIFFTFCLGFGLSVINRAAKREVVLARQRRNFMLSITHELKSPIASIRLILETIGKRELQRDQLNTLCTNGTRDAARLQNLVDDLLLAARLEDNWRPLAEPVNLQTIAQECASSLHLRFPKGVIRLEIPPQFAPVQADMSGLTAVVQNLLENALKYSPEGEPVVLAAERLNGRIRIRISDHGIGIPNEEKAAIFEKFYRVGNEETRRNTGTGLGLYIVKHVVEAHGGTITVTDNQPKGTIFTIEL